MPLPQTFDSLRLHLASVLRGLAPPYLVQVARMLRCWSTRYRGEHANPFQICWLGRAHIALSGAGRFEVRAGSNPDRQVVRHVFQNRGYTLEYFSRNAELVALRASMRDPVIIDCGANIGAATLWFAVTFPRARVIAVEPDPGNFEILRRNCSRLANVECVQGAVAGSSGKLALVDPDLGEWAYRTTYATNVEGRATVRSWTIDELLMVYGGTPYLLKIDIEGGEDDIFKTAGETIGRFPIIAMELHDWLFPGKANSRNFVPGILVATRPAHPRRKRLLDIQSCNEA